MANTTGGYGFRWVRTIGSGGGENPPIARIRAGSGASFLDAAGGNQIYLRPGDPIGELASGLCLTAYAGAGVLGIVQGFSPQYDSTLGAMRYMNTMGTVYAYGTDYTKEPWIYYIPVANQEFEIDAYLTGASTTVAPTAIANWIGYIHKNADHEFVTDTTNYIGNPKLDLTTLTAAGANSAQWRIVGIAPVVGNVDYTANNVRLRVVCNEVQQAPYVTATV